MHLAQTFFFLVIFCCLACVGNAHVRFVYPPARQYAIDMLNSRVTSGPCGMPRGTTQTDFQAGTTFNASWNMGSPHGGGYRVELLDKEYNLIETLVPKGGGPDDFYGNNSVASLAGVSLPSDITCVKCVLRMMKLGMDWTPTKESPHAMNVFRTCADVNIVNKDVASKCSGKGKWTGSSCVCTAPYAGDVCQYKDECAHDEDCGQGRCLDTAAQTFPKRQCYCPFGSHGELCALDSSVKNFDFKPKLYRSRASRYANFTLYWRILPDIGEIEVVAKAMTSNWIGVGWRSDETNATCKLFPNVAKETTASLSKDGDFVNNTLDFFDPKSPYMASPLHPMACTDIVYASTFGNYSRVRDMYTRDLSTPREDEIFGGTDSLTAALAFEDAGCITVLFRKKLLASEPPDQSVDGMMHVIWAIGIPPSVSSFSSASAPTSPFKMEEADIKTFYRKGELNSHAHSPASRGFFKINLKTGGSF